MTAYYNEIDKYAAQWLRNLIAAGHIAPGDVDERSITEVQPDDLRGYTQCHFFAGIGGWSYTLRLAGWPDDRPVWTGSCPCQPFSAAGAQRGSDDERHLWPAFCRLIGERRPASVFGEQVAGAAGLAWLDHVCADLEGAGYAAAAADLCAAGVGAPHIRQRLYWVAHADEGRGRRDSRAVPGPQARAERSLWGEPDGAESGGAALGLADSAEPRRSEQPQRDAGAHGWPAAESGRLRDAGSVGNAECDRLRVSGRAAADVVDESSDGSLCAWSNIEWIACSDGKTRPTQRGIFPLAYGLPGGGVAVGGAIADASLTEEQAAHRFSRVGVLRGAGNAIVPQVAAAFIAASERT